MVKKITCVILYLIVAVQILFIEYVNFFHTSDMLDYDSSLAFRHAQEIWESGTPVLQNFFTTSSLETDCAFFLAYPLYRLTRSMGFSVGVVHFVTLIIMLYFIFRILSVLKCSRLCKILSVALVLTPYKIGSLDYINMLFIGAGQYEYRVLSCLGIFYLLLVDRKSVKKLRLVFEMSIVLAFTAVSAFSCGSYVFLMIFFPFAAAVFLRYLIYGNTDEIKSDAIFIVLTGIFVFVCMKFHNSIPSLNERREYYLCNGKNFGDNLISCITAVFIFTGGVPDGQINARSGSGLAYMMRFILVLSMIIFIFFSIIKQVFNSEKLKKSLHIFYLIALCNLGALMVLDTHYGSDVFESRYHIIWIVPMFVFVSVCFDIWLKSEKIPHRVINTVCVSLLSVMVFINAINMANVKYYFFPFTIEESEAKTLYEKYNVDALIFYDTPESQVLSHRLRTLSNIEAITASENFANESILDYYHGVGDSVNIKTNLLLTSEEAFETLPENIKELYTMKEKDEIYAVYYTESGRVDLASGFPEYNSDEVFDFSYSPEYVYSGGRLNGTFKAPTDSSKYIYSAECEGHKISVFVNDREVSPEHIECNFGDIISVSIDDADEDLIISYKRTII